MNDVEVRAAVELLVGTELSVADHGELADAATAVARVQAFVDLAKAQIARRGRVLADQGHTSSNHVLIDEGRCTGTDATPTNGRDRVCESVRGFEDALAAGNVTGAHLDALAHHTEGLGDQERSDDDHRHVTWTRPDGTTWHTDTGPTRRPSRRTRSPGPAPPTAARTCDIAATGVDRNLARADDPAMRT